MIAPRPPPPPPPAADRFQFIAVTDLEVSVADPDPVEPLDGLEGVFEALEPDEAVLGDDLDLEDVADPREEASEVGWGHGHGDATHVDREDLGWRGRRASVVTTSSSSTSGGTTMAVVVTSEASASAVRHLLSGLAEIKGNRNAYEGKQSGHSIYHLPTLLFVSVSR